MGLREQQSGRVAEWEQSVSTPDPDPREVWSVPGFSWPARRSEYDSRTQPLCFVLFSV